MAEIVNLKRVRKDKVRREHDRDVAALIADVDRPGMGGGRVNHLLDLGGVAGVDDGEPGHGEHQGQPLPALGHLLGAGGGRTHTVIGDTVNVASRLEAKAPVGGVAIGARTLALLPGAVTEPLGPLELKGKAEPVEAHVLRSL